MLVKYIHWLSLFVQPTINDEWNKRHLKQESRIIYIPANHTRILHTDF
jgi:hypothetical protein